MITLTTAAKAIDAQYAAPLAKVLEAIFLLDAIEPMSAPSLIALEAAKSLSAHIRTEHVAAACNQLPGNRPEVAWALMGYSDMGELESY